MTRILVTGAKGQLGQALTRLVSSFEWTFLDRAEFDLELTENIKIKLEKFDFDILINAAAYTAVDDAEDNADSAFKINALALEPIAEVCKAKSALLIHISTDYVFGNVSPSPIREDDEPGPSGVYGKSKWEGEQIIRKVMNQHCILRTSWLYGPDGKNFMKTMLQIAQSGKEINVVCDQVGCPTLVDHLANAILRICERYDQNPTNFPFGTYHYSNEGVGSWYDFAQAIFEISGHSMVLNPVRSEAFPTKAQRPAYSVLDKQKIKDTFDLQVSHWRNALRSCLKEIKEQ